jgi:DNA-binding transcriptional MerR regulator
MTDGGDYFTTKDVLKQVGISRNTLFLWLKKGKIPEVVRDRNGHRLFTPQDVAQIVAFKDQKIFPEQPAHAIKRHG